MLWHISDRISWEHVYTSLYNDESHAVKIFFYQTYVEDLVIRYHNKNHNISGHMCEVFNIYGEWQQEHSLAKSGRKVSATDLLTGYNFC